MANASFSLLFLMVADVVARCCSVLFLATSTELFAQGGTTLLLGLAIHIFLLAQFALETAHECAGFGSLLLLEFQLAFQTRRATT